jgi:transcriptional regulator with XRE-family HTH domain
VPLQSFGKRLAQLRREKAYLEECDIDRRDVAKAADASPSSVTRWENGEVWPGEETMTALAAYFGVNKSWLRYGEGEKRPATATVEVVAGAAPRRPRAAESPTKRQKGAR